MKRLGPTLAATAALALLLSGCSGSGDSGGSTPSTGTGPSDTPFVLGLGSDPGTVSPYTTTLGTAKQLMYFGYDSLVTRKNDGSTVGVLAEKWDSTPTSATYTLKDGITCQDGTKLTATHVADAFTYISDPATLSPWLSRTIPVKFAVKADDDARTVTLTTAEPFGDLLNGAGSLPIVCPANLKNPQELTQRFGGTGPYTITEYVAGDHVTMALRDDYTWGPDGFTSKTDGVPKTVTVRFVANASTMANLLLDGTVNAAQVLGPDAVRVADAAKLVKMPAMAAEIHYNQQEGHATADPQVRKALTMVLPIDDLVKVSTHGTGTRATNLMVRTPVLCPADVVTKVMPKGTAEQAGKLLDNAGWKLGTDGLRSKDGAPLELKATFFSGQDDTTAQMELMAATWKKLGVTLKLEPVTNAVFRDVFYGNGAWDVAQAGYNQEFPFQMIGQFDGALPPKGLNASGIDDPGFQKYTTAAMGKTGTSGCDDWNNAWRALIKDAAIVPISVWDRGYYVTGADAQALTGLYLDPFSLRMAQ